MKIVKLFIVLLIICSMLFGCRPVLPQKDVIDISTADELQAISQVGLDKSYRLIKNIDLENVKWTPIGKKFHPFSGSFDGNGYTIKNLNDYYDDGSEYIGLFGNTKNSIIRNLHLETSVAIKSDSNITMQYIGGLSGRSEFCRFSNVRVKISTSVSSNSNNIYIGGISGYFNTASMVKCHVEGSISATTETISLGGVLGYSNLSTIEEVNASVDLLASTDANRKSNIGGFVGNLTSGFIKNSCVNKSTISASLKESYAGGFCGIGNGDISYSYSIFISQNLIEYGGFIGHRNPLLESFLTKCYFDSDISKTENGVSNAEFSGIFPKSTSEMKKPDTFLQWSSDAWYLAENSYPMLKSVLTQGGGELCVNS